MSKVTRKSKKAGLPPGTLVHIGKKRTEKVKIKVIDYSESDIQEKELDCLEDCCSFKDKPTVSWINVDGVHEVSILEKMGECYGLHPLVLEDIVNTEQRPKLEDFTDYMFIVLKMLRYDEKEKKVDVEQVSIIFGSNYVLSFQETEGDVFDSVRSRLRKDGSSIRKKGPDYLAYALIDAIVDGYFLILEKIGEDIEDIEDELIDDPSPKTLQAIHALKRTMITLRRSVWPLREVVNGMERVEAHLIKKPTKLYLRDVYDHTIQVIDTIETYRDILSGMLDIYLSSISNRMNEVMKVLTVIATIFIPLTFIAGVYGMNFNPSASAYSMPELNWEWGYVMVWAIMVAIAGGMLAYFRRRGWL